MNGRGMMKSKMSGFLSGEGKESKICNGVGILWTLIIPAGVSIGALKC